MSIQNELNLADELVDQGNYPAAISTYTKIIKQDPQCDEAWLMLGSLYGETGQIDKAIEYVEKAISLKPGDGFSYLTLGHIKNAIGDEAAALQAFIKARECNPDDIETLCTLASLQQQQGNISDAIKNYEHALTIDESLYNAWSILGPLHFQNNNLQAAETCFKKAISLNPADPATFLGVCSLLNHIDRSAEALELLKQLPAEAKNEPEVLLQLAITNSKQGLHSEAVDYIEQAIKISPAERFILGKADVLERKGEIENVFEILKPYLETKPPVPSAVILFSKISDALDLNQECLQLLDSILSNDMQPSLSKDEALKAVEWVNSNIN